MARPENIDEYKKLILNLEKSPDDLKIATTRYLCRTDLFFLLWFGFGRQDVAKPWLLARCREVESDPNDCLDLWSREHYKSTIITYGKTIQDILASHGDDPMPEWKGVEPTFGIFSCTRPIAKGFLRQIKREFETNTLLKNIFPDVIWENCQRDAPKWSEDDGIILKRRTNPKESTLEAWGIVDGQPTSKHFTGLIYDDVVTKESVTTPDMIAKVTESWELSLNLGSAGGFRRYIGTRYHFNDTYRTIMSRDVAKPRIYPATVDGTPDGEPVLIEKEALQFKRKAMGPYTFACQMLLNPVADENQGFKRDWIKYHQGTDGAGMNKYILVDPANEKKKSNDYTVFAVVGLGSDENYYLLDLVRDRLNLLQRCETLFSLHRKWRPITVGYEHYGMMADIQYMKERMSKENYHFNIMEMGGRIPKNDRIKTLVPLFAQGRWFLPNSLFKTDYEGKTHDLVDVFINEEFTGFPVSVHDDMLDAMARITDESLSALFPINYQRQSDYQSKTHRSLSSWSA